MTTWLMALAVAASGSTWPRIAPLDRSFPVFDPPHAVVRADVMDSTGRPVYLFVCRNVDDESVANVIYAGDLDCRLMPAGPEREENLLVEEESLAAWYSRARMFAKELTGACASYPEHGLIRHFKLRGMRLTMAFERVAFGNDGKLASYVLHLTASPDSTATSAIAESSGYLDPNVARPGRSCSVVRRGDDWAPRESRGRRTMR
jgi:hypothetical protein